MRCLLCCICVLAVVSCESTHQSRPCFEVKRALGKETSLFSLCSDVSITPLDNIQNTNIAMDNLLLEVSNQYFYLLDRSNNQVAVYDKNGAYVSLIKPSDTVIDISSYEDKYLDLLIGGGALEYSADGSSLLHEFSFRDCGIELRSLARRDDNVLVLTGTSSGKAYDCEFFIDRNSYIEMESPVADEEDYFSGSFFRCEGTTYFYCSSDGEVSHYTNDDFSWTAHKWQFKETVSSFSNVQKTSTNYYLQFTFDGDKNVLVFDESSGKYLVVQKTKEGVIFPLGVIHGNTNYYCCRSDQLYALLSPDYLDEEGKTKYQESIVKESNVIISYSLR